MVQQEIQMGRDLREDLECDARIESREKHWMKTGIYWPKIVIFGGSYVWLCGLSGRKQDKKKSNKIFSSTEHISHDPFDEQLYSYVPHPKSSLKERACTHYV